MRTILTFITLFMLAASGLAQTQGPVVRATNGVARGLFLASTNTSSGGSPVANLIGGDGGSTASLYVSDGTAPTSGVETGDLWLNSGNGFLFIRDATGFWNRLVTTNWSGTSLEFLVKNGPTENYFTLNANGSFVAPVIRATTNFIGNGSGLTNLGAANIATGGTLPVLNAASLTNLNASNLASGTVPNARIGILTNQFVATSLHVADASGNNDTKLSTSSGGVFSILEPFDGANPVNIDDGAVSATSFSGGGASLTNLNAANLASGTVAAARLPVTVSTNGGALVNGTILVGDGGRGEYGTNRVTLATVDGAVTFNGNITDTQNGVSTVISSNYVATGTILSTNVNVANTGLKLNGAQNGATGNVIDYTTNNVIKFSVDTTGAATFAGTISGTSFSGTGDVNAGAARQIVFSTRAGFDSPAVNKIRMANNNIDAFPSGQLIFGPTQSTNPCLQAINATTPGFRIFNATTNGAADLIVSGTLTATNGVQSYGGITDTQNGVSTVISSNTVVVNGTSLTGSTNQFQVNTAFANKTLSVGTNGIVDIVNTGNGFNPSLRFGGGAYGFSGAISSGAGFSWANGSTLALQFAPGSLTLPSGAVFNISSTTSAAGLADIGLGRNAAGVLEINSGALGNLTATLKTGTIIATNTVTATNGVMGASGSMCISTGTVSVATSASTNLVSNQWNYTTTFGDIGVETNTSLVITNARNPGPRISLGIAYAGSDTDAITLQVWTNHVFCSLLSIHHTTAAGAPFERGFISLDLPPTAANTRVSLYVGNAAANAVNIKGVRLLVGGPN